MNNPPKYPAALAMDLQCDPGSCERSGYHATGNPVMDLNCRANDPWREKPCAWQQQENAKKGCVKGF